MIHRRKKWQQVLEGEIRRLEGLTAEQLISEFKDAQVYEVHHDQVTYQVEIELIENTPEYVHINLAVDDGHLPAAILPVCRSIIRRKE